MADKKWIQKANKQMKRKGTVGAFTNYCGGRVTQDCIDRAKNSDDPTLRRRAQFAENMRGLGTKKGRDGIRKRREEMSLGGILKGLGAVAKKVGSSGKFTKLASAAGKVGGSAGGVGGKALSGFASGASMGAALGPIGAVAGGLVGGIAGFFKGRKAKKEAEEAQAQAEADEKKMTADMIKAQYQAQYDAVVQNMPQENYENVNTGVAYQEGGRKKGVRHLLDYMEGSPGPKSKKDRDEEQDTLNKLLAKGKISQKEWEKASLKLKNNPTEKKMYGGDREEAVEGKRKLPGGLELKLKSGAKKFVGNKHDEAGNGSDSGIILEESTKAKKGLEVEDGELEVKDEKGSYIVSDFLKNPETGNTLAEDLEKELEGLDKDKDAEKIKKINKKYIDLNEEIKDEKKEPEGVKAAHGLRRKYMQEGGRGIKTFEEFKTAYPKFEDPIGAYTRYIEDMTGGEASFDGTNVMEASEVQGTDLLPMTLREVEEVVRPDQTIQPTGRSISEGIEDPGEESPISFLKNELEEVEVPLQAAAEDEAEEQSEKGGKLANFLDKAKDKLGNIPRGYGQGTMLQALGAAAYLKNRDDPMAPILAPSYLNRIPPAEYKSFAPERAAATAAFNAQKNAIDTSIAGPAAIAARQAALASQAANMSKIATQDVRERAQINQLNANNELRVALANQKAYNDTTRANATAKYAAELEKFKNKYAALQKIGDTSAQALKDRRAAQSERLFAAATQIGGAFDRAEERYGFNKLFPGLSADENAEAGLTPEDAGALLTGNEAAADTTEEVQAEEQERRGGRRKKRYIKRKGTVRRRKIKKK